MPWRRSCSRRASRALRNSSMRTRTLFAALAERSRSKSLASARVAEAPLRSAARRADAGSRTRSASAAYAASAGSSAPTAARPSRARASALARERARLARRRGDAARDQGGPRVRGARRAEPLDLLERASAPRGGPPRPPRRRPSARVGRPGARRATRARRRWRRKTTRRRDRTPSRTRRRTRRPPRARRPRAPGAPRARAPRPRDERRGFDMAMWRTDARGGGGGRRRAQVFQGRVPVGGKKSLDDCWGATSASIRRRQAERSRLTRRGWSTLRRRALRHHSSSPSRFGPPPGPSRWSTPRPRRRKPRTRGLNKLRRVLRRARGRGAQGVEAREEATRGRDEARRRRAQAVGGREDRHPRAAPREEDRARDAALVDNPLRRDRARRTRTRTPPRPPRPRSRASPAALGRPQRGRPGEAKPDPSCASDAPGGRPRAPLVRVQVTPPEGRATGFSRRRGRRPGRRRRGTRWRRLCSTASIVTRVAAGPADAMERRRRARRRRRRPWRPREAEDAREAEGTAAEARHVPARDARGGPRAPPLPPVAARGYRGRGRRCRSYPAGASREARGAMPVPRGEAGRPGDGRPWGARAGGGHGSDGCHGR